MNKIRILMLCLLTTFGYAQKKMSKTLQSIKVNKDVVVELNTSYIEIELDTWNKDVVEVEAYIEGVKLSENELKEALENWNLKIDGSNNLVVISSEGGGYLNRLFDHDFSGVLQNLEYHLAELPEIPQLPEIPNFPALPEMPELPDLPSGVQKIIFDYDRYQEEGEAYLSQWSKQYAEKGGKELQERMEAWAKSFSESGYQEKMEKWGEEFGKRFSEEWSEKMEVWGNQFGEQMEEEVGLIEKHAKSIKREAEIYKKDAERLKRIAELEKRKSKRVDALETRKEQRKEALQNAVEKRKSALEHRREIRTHALKNRLDAHHNSNVRKVIKIKIPKKAKLKTNIRHGELKISSVISDMKGDISHSFLVAEHINGSDTSINVSYSPVMINTWDLGTLNLNFVDKAQIKTAQNLVLNSKSSNVTIIKLTDTAIIDGSFGDLTISDLSTTFKNLNLVLENSDALINLPKDVDYTLYFKGNRSKFNNKTTEQKTIRNYPKNDYTNRNVIVNAKFSDVIIN